jgi:hypothetical protein
MKHKVFSLSLVLVASIFSIGAGLGPRPGTGGGGANGGLSNAYHFASGQFSVTQDTNVSLNATIAQLATNRPPTNIVSTGSDVSIASGHLAIPSAGASARGALTSTDWNAFDAKNRVQAAADTDPEGLYDGRIGDLYVSLPDSGGDGRVWVKTSDAGGVTGWAETELVAREELGLTNATLLALIGKRSPTNSPTFFDAITRRATSAGTFTMENYSDENGFLERELIDTSGHYWKDGATVTDIFAYIRDGTDIGISFNPQGSAGTTNRGTFYLIGAGSNDTAVASLNINAAGKVTLGPLGGGGSGGGGSTNFDSITVGSFGVSNKQSSAASTLDVNLAAYVSFTVTNLPTGDLGGVQLQLRGGVHCHA